VQPRRRLAPARQDEALQLGQGVVVLVAEPLELVDLRLRDAQPPVAGGKRNREVGA
jgi:hypothetical protein